jgi:hypothetical protein
VDQLAMNAAYKAGGTVISVPARSLSRILKSPGVRRAVHTGRTVICSPCAPDSRFSVARPSPQQAHLRSLRSSCGSRRRPGLRRYLVRRDGSTEGLLLPGRRLARPRRRPGKRGSSCNGHGHHYRRIPTTEHPRHRSIRERGQIGPKQAALF